MKKKVLVITLKTGEIVKLPMRIKSGLYAVTKRLKDYDYITWRLIEDE